MLALASASSAISLPPYEPDPLDSERVAATEARRTHDVDRALELRHRILERDPVDGYTLREVVLARRDGLGLPDLARRLASGSAPSDVPEVARTPEGRAFMLGLTEYYRRRLISALAAFDASVDARSDWAWPRFYRLRLRRELAMSEPVKQEADLRVVEQDPVVAREWVESGIYLAKSRDLGDALETYREALDAGYATPLNAQFRRELDVLAELHQVSDELSAFRDTWTRSLAECPACDDRLVYDLFAEASSRLSADEIMSLADVVAEHPDLQNAARSAEVGALKGLGYHALCSTMSADLDVTSTYVLRQKLDFMVEGDADPDTLRASANALIEHTLDSAAVESVRRCLRFLGLSARADSVDALVRRENPALALQRRLDDLIEQDVDQAAAMLDSLTAAGVSADRFPRRAIEVAEIRGRYDDVDRLQTGNPWHVVSAAYRSATLERRERARTLAERALALEPNNLFLMHSVARIAFEIDDESFARDMLARMRERCDGTPVLIQLELDVINRFDSPAAAQARLDTWLQRQDDLDVDPLTVLYAYAGMYERPDAMRRIAERVIEAHPRARWARLMVAGERIRGGALAEAQAMLGGLLEELPGEPRYRSMLVSAGGQVPGPSPETTETDELAHVFDAFEHDLDDVDWILERMASEDTVSAGYGTRTLLSQASLSSVGPSRLTSRRRTTIQVLARDGLVDVQPMRIAFRAGRSMPRVRVARVIHPDGRITDVSRSDFYVSSSSVGNADIDDWRELTIPFPDLTVGCSLDLVFDQHEESFFDGGWSVRHLFGGFSPILEEVLELRVRRDSPLHLMTHDDVAPADTWTDGTYALHRWRVEAPELWVATDVGNLIESYPWVAASTYASWPDAVREYARTFWSRVEASDEIRELATRVTADAHGEREIVAALFRHIVSEVEYLSIALDRGSVVPTAAREVARRGYGDCKDMVVLMLACLEAVGVDAEPVLLAPRPDVRIHEDQPEPGEFTHVIVRVHVGSGREVFCDLTSGIPCYDYLPAADTGVTGLVLPRGDDATLVDIPLQEPDRTGMELEVDIFPESARRARIEVSNRLTGDVAAQLHGLMEHPDTNVVNYVITRALGYGLWSSCRRVDWAMLESECEDVTLRGTFVDTSWAPDRNTVAFRHDTEVADPFLSFPDVDQRGVAIELAYPYRGHATLRFHHGAGWRADEEVVPLSVAGPGYEGRIRARTRSDGDDRWVEVTQDFAMDRVFLDGDAYRTFRKDWLRFRAGVVQPYSYNHLADESEFDSIRAYVKDYPDDHGFVIQAVARILGNDVGGAGEEGERRRTFAHDLLADVAGDTSAGPYPLFLLAAIELADGRHFLADSLADTAGERAPSDLLVLQLRLGIKQELGDVDGEIEILEQIDRQYGSRESQLALVDAFCAAGRHEDAVRLERRIFALHPETDSLTIVRARIGGHSRRNECDRLEEDLSRFASLKGDPDELEQHRVGYDWACGDVAATIPTLEDVYERDPTNPTSCNNLAWSLALCGRDLDRAEELMETALILSADDPTYRNTLAAIQMRRGKWDAALELVERVLADDDRPLTQMVNRYFAGLCHYARGDHERGISTLETASDVECALGRKWRQRISDSLERARRGESPLDVLFVDVPMELTRS